MIVKCKWGCLQGVIASTPRGGSVSLFSDSAACQLSGPHRLHCTTASLVTASLHGVLKAAAAELGPLKRISTFLRDTSVPATSSHGRQVHPQQHADVHGSLNSGGLLSCPHLLMHGGCSSTASHTAHIGDGQMLISGGLGALGLLVSVWLAQMRRTTCLHLLGRTGRHSDGSRNVIFAQATQVNCLWTGNDIACECHHSIGWFSASTKCIGTLTARLQNIS